MKADPFSLGQNMPTSFRTRQSRWHYEFSSASIISTFLDALVCASRRVITGQSMRAIPLDGQSPTPRYLYHVRSRYACSLSCPVGSYQNIHDSSALLVAKMLAPSEPPADG